MTSLPSSESGSGWMLQQPWSLQGFHFLPWGLWSLCLVFSLLLGMSGFDIHRVSTWGKKVLSGLDCGGVRRRTRRCQEWNLKETMPYIVASLHGRKRRRTGLEDFSLPWSSAHELAIHSFAHAVLLYYTKLGWDLSPLSFSLKATNAV